MRYKVLTPVDLDSKRLEPGKLIELESEVADPLLQVQAIEPAPTKAQAAADDKP